MLETGVLRETLQAVSDAVLVTGPNGDILWTNAAFTALTGYTQEEVAGKNPRLLKSGVHDAGFYGELWSTVLAGSVWTGEITNRRKDGSLYVEHQTITPVQDATGAVTHLIAVKRDVSESKANYLNLFERMPEGCAVLELVTDAASDRVDLRFVAVNPAFERLSGLRDEAVAGRSLRDVLPGLEDDWTEICRRVGATDDPAHLQHYSRALRRHFDITAYRSGNGHIAVLLDDVTEQRETAARLGESEARYRRIVEAAWEGIWEIDAQHLTVFVNGRMARMLGYTREEMTGRPLMDFVEESFAGDAEAALARIRAGDTEPRDCRFRRRDGSELWFLVSAMPYFDKTGQYTGATAMLADITGRRQAERQLEVERAQLLSIFDAVEGPVYVSDPHTYEVLYVNRSLRTALGRDPVGGKCYEQLQGKEAPCSFCTNPLIFSGGEKSYHWRIDSPVLGRTYDLTDRVIHWPDGRDVRLELACDVTERVRAEAQLREAHQLLDTLVQSAPVAVIALDSERRVRMWNPAAERLSGWSAADLLGQPFPAPPQAGSHAAIGRVLAGETLSGVEFPATRKDGSTLDISASGAPLRNAAGEITGVAIIAMDVGERKRLEAQLLQSQKLEVVGRLAGGVAHDFNNLLTIINGHADLIMMETGNSGQPAYENAAEIKIAGERAARLTQRLLAFSRKQVMQPRLLDLNAVVNESQRMLQRLIGEDVEVVVNLAPEPGRVKADPALLQQALINLAVNARDAMPEGGRLIIQTDILELSAGEGGLEPGRYATLAVTDTGTGMDEDTKAHLFEPFFTTKPAGRGTGLGLSTVYGVVKQSGGQVFVESEPGKGSTFRICLPWAAGSESPATAPVPDVSPEVGGNETVLVLEDQAEVRRLVSSALGRYGYQVLEAADGTEALAVAERHDGPIHLILADVVMPGMSGKEVAERLMAARPGMKVLFMSGYAEDVLAHHGILQAGFAYIAKPFAPEALAAKVREVLGKACRVLVVDDERAVRALLCAMLTKAGYEVAEAADGRRALELVGSFNPLIVLMDLVMPDQEGIETIRVLARERPEVKIIAMSGAFPGAFLEGTVYLGAHATLTKPIDPGALLETVRGLASERLV